MKVLSTVVIVFAFVALGLWIFFSVKDIIRSVKLRKYRKSDKDNIKKEDL